MRTSIRLFIATTFVLSMWCGSGSFAQSVGTWKAYMAYHDITEVEQGGQMLYVLASKNLYGYSESDHSIQTYDKMNGLTDCNIAHIAWSAATKLLLIIYENQNIDLLSADGEVVNMPQYYMKSVAGDKTVNRIYMHNEYAYLATGFGVVKLNMQRAEISDAYQLGFSVNYCYIEDNYLYAASAQSGLYRGLLTNNLLDKNQWERVGGYVDQPQTIDPDLLAKAQQLNPGGPKYNHFGFMRWINNNLYTCGGGYLASVDHNRPGTIQVLSGDDWTVYEDDFAATKCPGVDYVDIMSVDVDPLNANHVFAGGRTGVYEFLNGKFQQRYSYQNSPLASVFGTDDNYVIIKAIKFDKSGNLWCFVNMTNSPAIAVRDKSGNWDTVDSPLLKTNSGNNFPHLENVFMDSRGLFWVGNNYWSEPAIVCFQPSTKGLSVVKSFVNQDGTTVEVNGGIESFGEDKNGDIWVGTSAAPLLLSQSAIGSNTPTFTQPKVPRNDGTNYADYLLNGIDISAMVIDGGNRKWFGTGSNGIYVIGSDNVTELYHFTSENSPLLSNSIESMAINPKTGEIFIGTDKGLCSYLSDASEPSENMSGSEVYAYPNPVRPEYSGPIVITGLSYDADVKIVTSNGVLVHQGRSTGGMYTWDGTDLKGRRVASGVYMVETATSTGKKGTVCKIAIIR